MNRLDPHQYTINLPIHNVITAKLNRRRGKIHDMFEYIYIYIYIYIHGSINKFLDFFSTGIYNCCRLLKIQYVIAIHLIKCLTNFYDFRFKWTATAGIGIHPTKAWLSQLVNFKNAIWTWGHIRRTICNKILF